MHSATALCVRVVLIVDVSALGKCKGAENRF
jgi:hypothetical protein